MVVGESAPADALPVPVDVEDVLAGSVADVVGRIEAAAPTPVNATGMVGVSPTTQNGELELTESVSVTSFAED